MVQKDKARLAAKLDAPREVAVIPDSMKLVLAIFSHLFKELRSGFDWHFKSK